MSSCQTQHFLARCRNIHLKRGSKTSHFRNNSTSRITQINVTLSEQIGAVGCPICSLLIEFSLWEWLYKWLADHNSVAFQQIKTEANIPALISFVDKLYAPTFELVNKKRDKMVCYSRFCRSRFCMMGAFAVVNSLRNTLNVPICIPSQQMLFSWCRVIH